MFGGAGRRTPCAWRAVMLTAVRSLRLAGSERALVPGELADALRAQREL